MSRGFFVAIINPLDLLKSALLTITITLLLTFILDLIHFLDASVTSLSLRGLNLHISWICHKLCDRISIYCIVDGVLRLSIHGL